VTAFTVTDDYFTIKRMAPVRGRLFSPQEFERGMPVIVIGQDVADYFFPALDPVGRELTIRGIPYQIVGLMEKQGSAFGISFDKFIVAPHKSPINRFVNAHGVIDAIMIQTPSREGMLGTMEIVRQVMRARRGLRPAEKDNFELETSDSALEFWNKIKSYLVIAGVALPAIGLVVGAIVIMNIMLVAVAERTREIGIRKSLGARRRDIMSQFLVESATLSTVGAALGVATGFAFAKLIATVTPLPAAVELWSVFLGVGIGAGVGIIAGAYPASRASRLDPITALRAE
jgi:putative ABC transport system permease protein